MSLALGRCTYCHGEFEQGDARFTCACRASTHADCRELLGRCTTVGCAAPGPAPQARPLADVLVLGRGLSWIWRLLVAIVFLPAAVAAGTVAGVTLLNGTAPLGGLVAALLATAVCGALGTLALLGEEEVHLVAGGARAEEWHHLRVPLVGWTLWSACKRRVSTAPLDHVDLARQVTVGEKGRESITYLVTLGARGREGPLVLGERSSLPPARALAERVAKHLHLGVLDCTTAERPTLRPKGTLDQPLALRPAGDADDRALAPPALGPLRWRPQGGGLAVAGERLDRGKAIGCMAAWAVLAGAPPLAHLAAGEASLPALVGGAALVGLPLLILTWAGFVRQDLTADPTGVTVTTSLGPLRRRARIEAEDLEEVVVTRDGERWALTCHADARTLRFGGGSERAALERLAAAVRVAVRPRRACGKEDPARHEPPRRFDEEQT